MNVRIRALGDQDEGWLVHAGAARALWDITGQDFGEDADRWQEWWEQQ